MSQISITSKYDYSRKSLLNPFYVIFIISFFFSGASAFGWNWGLRLQNVSAITHAGASDLTDMQSNRAVFSLSTPMGNQASFRSSLSVSYLNTFNLPNIPPTLPNPYLTLDVLQFSFQGFIPVDKLGVFDWTLGRVSQEDLTGWVFNALVDGAELGWRQGSMHVALKGFYTGLVEAQDSQIMLSTNDYLDQLNYYSLGGPLLFQSGPQRVLGIFDYDIAQFFERQNLSLEVIGQYDTRTLNPVQTSYFSLELSGPIEPFSYRAYSTANLLSGPQGNSWSLMSGFHIAWNFTDPQWELFTEGLYTKGLTSGVGDGFVPITLLGPSSVLTSLSLWNIAEGALGVTLHPLFRFTGGAKISSLFQTGNSSQNSSNASRNGNYQPYVSYLDPANTQPYLGSQAELFASWTPTSEWSFSLTLAGFLPSHTAFLDTNIIWLSALSASLKF